MADREMTPEDRQKGKAVCDAGQRARGLFASLGASKDEQDQAFIEGIKGEALKQMKEELGWEK